VVKNWKFLLKASLCRKRIYAYKNQMHKVTNYHLNTWQLRHKTQHSEHHMSASSNESYGEIFPRWNLKLIMFSRLITWLSLALQSFKQQIATYFCHGSKLQNWCRNKNPKIQTPSYAFFFFFLKQPLSAFLKSKHIEYTKHGTRKEAQIFRAHKIKTQNK
jgi:hypothetical protein